MVFDEASITGVEVMPISGVRSAGSLTSVGDTVVTPVERKLTCHNWTHEGESASNAYTLSCSVAIYTTFRVCPPTFRLATYSGVEYTYPSTAHVNSAPKVELFTVEVVSAYSCRFWPVRALSLW